MTKTFDDIQLRVRSLRRLAIRLGQATHPPTYKPPDARASRLIVSQLDTCCDEIERLIWTLGGK
jgi:hypothetical protein